MDSSEQESLAGLLLCESLTRDFIVKTETAPNMNVAMDMLADTVQMLGYSMVCYSYMPTTRLPDGRWAPPPLLTRNYPEKWDVRWDRHNANDPYYHACFDGDLTVEWSSIQGRDQLTPVEQDSWHYLADKQIHRGLTVPIHLPGRRFAFVSAISYADEEAWASLVRTTRQTLFVVAHHFHSATFHRFQNPFPQRRPNELSFRERECLQWAANGKTTEDIACILGLSAETVRIHLKRACAKLGAANRANAVAKASYLGMIDFPH